jgi:hypothetical protein
MSRIDVWYMARRRAADAGIETPIGCHTFRANGITDYLTNGWAYVSKWRNKWPVTPTRKPPGLLIGANYDISVAR